jgi:hypothetical protein
MYSCSKCREFQFNWAANPERHVRGLDAGGDPGHRDKLQAQESQDRLHELVGKLFCSWPPEVQAMIDAERHRSNPR